MVAGERLTDQITLGCWPLRSQGTRLTTRSGDREECEAAGVLDGLVEFEDHPQEPGCLLTISPGVADGVPGDPAGDVPQVEPAERSDDHAIWQDAPPRI